MDRKKAIQMLKRCEAESYCNHYKQRHCCIGCGQREALDLAIGALGQTESDDCDNFYKGYCSVYEDGCFHQCEKDCINRKQAIEALTGWQTEPLDEDIVRTLEELPPVPQKQVTGKLKNPCDSLLKPDSDECKEQKSKLDCISRQDAIEQIDKWHDFYAVSSLRTDKARRDELSAIKAMLINLPSLPPVTPTERTGEWVATSNGGMTFWYACSECHHAGDMKDKFCRNCGCKMGGNTE